VREPLSINPLPRPVGKRVLIALRRSHLYLGLFFFPWAILYGVTAFLFNHPTAFADQPTATFGHDALAGTPLDPLPTAAGQAAELVARLNESQRPATPYAVAGEARYNREFAFATVKADGQTVSVLLDVKAGGGTIRSAPAVEKPRPEPAPFVTGMTRPVNLGQAATPPGFPNDFAARFRDAVPTLLARAGFPGGEVTVTSVPDIVVPVTAGGRTWAATYNPMTGAVTGTPADATPPADMTWRRFLLRLHTAHGYPGEANGRWAWALVVDATAATLCFWGLSGLLMWWQVKATRLGGAVVLAVSAAAATALGVAMRAALTS
jgi:hypothetical protein